MQTSWRLFALYCGTWQQHWSRANCEPIRTIRVQRGQLPRGHSSLLPHGQSGRQSSQSLLKQVGVGYTAELQDLWPKTLTRNNPEIMLMFAAALD